MSYQFGPATEAVFAREPALSGGKLDRLVTRQALGLLAQIFLVRVFGQRS
jgi:hypothetical protein